MKPFYFLLYTFLLTLYLFAFSAKGKVISIKRSHNEVVVGRKATNVHASINTFDSKDKARWNRSIFVHSKRQHRHLKEFPQFNVIKCIVESMWPKKADNVDSSATKHGADFLGTMDVGKLGTANICRIRYRRHQRVMKSQSTDRPSPTDGSDRRLADETYLNYSHTMKSMPQRNANCSVISEFLSNPTNLNFIRQKATDLSCVHQHDMSALVEAASKLTDVRLATESHRVKSVRRWRHLSCRFYHRFLQCWPKEASSSNGPAAPSESNSDKETTMTTTTTTMTTKDLYRTSAADLGTTDKEAVHVSDSSHIDFLNFMIGYNPGDNDDYQMWFY